MSIRPIQFNPDGSIDVVYDETGHSGTIVAADVKWATNTDGSDNHNFIILDCPDGCGGSSTWPVGGGTDPPMGQEMFVRKVNAEGCVCGSVERTAPAQDAIDHVKELVTAMDGEERWQVDGDQLLEALA